jgi:hypothetical protein
VRMEKIFQDGRFIGFDEDGGSPANIAASGASHWTRSESEEQRSARSERKRTEQSDSDRAPRRAEEE